MKPSYQPGKQRLLRAKEAAQYLAISARKLWELVNRGIIPAVRLDGRMVRLDRADLDAFIEARRTTGRGGVR
jgi:excisionase family DNA binding protein